MIIRALTDEDVTAFQQIMKISITGICAEAYGADTAAAWVSDDNPAFHFTIPEFAFVVEEGGEIIAVGGWSRTDVVDLHPIGDRTVINPTHARINAVYIRPGSEGHGLGHKIMSHLEADIKSRTALRDIYLWSTKNAIRFYQAMGYTPGIDKYPEVAPGYKIQIRYMWKRLE
ncbi:MAG: GNAT family N-acetyltransferase [Alphaproteobacteria bacterium]|nr:GNAT family N-acetyltransferase [Alphaproteobacteria bacterium]